MNVLLLGASGMIGQRIADELLDRGHAVTGTSRSGDVDGVEGENFATLALDATDADAVADAAADHDAVISALGPSEDADLDILVEMADAILDGLRESETDRLLWVGGAGSLYVAEDTQFIETEDFPDELVPLAQAHIDAFEVVREADDVEWSYLAPPGIIEPGERTGDYRTAEGELVVDDEGDSYITCEDYAIAVADELEAADEVHTHLGVGY
ncbi:NAD(P)H-binding protein [Halosimplex litoreum]|uniref:NAD(P)H-binding protein n=1 Tax=Halosimplex litoreum TaxID=1198301 RepID=A0A7T3KUE9_9EURY|nr:NAD(P)H-binding protein [Halosimplex litoreum]QPV62019.1 NAD(P)H-binding protein [Halosimplex litoreum]